ncbi:hypothetical protein PSN45_004219 [Yamadazyma tenuis]|uniref:NAD(P)-binding protein n=1 Tax=Candida tenuis (strain ATCC 10573 / BCRC 21748 / CBS 615 / JCM 9827 / NBRC 10315 / NRRL Y-1498 / VKM Y-70) TaxID=590646 RepID=G3B6L8_CANTC|nr:NAD(P)-binding protein [Yamadazyma tenuis ATCC 10573]EGV63500.1 NAD(P)-binding protein [Yamadazyma tenuis ATCC 10573]WEJ96676.1 hypothetical protein PSN45_004219 [Yamadazyma tenuis]
MSTVLVTGATGHTGVFTVLEYIKNGYKVNTTMRDISQLSEVKEMIQKTGNLSDEAMKNIRYFQADLGKEEGWKEAIDGCEYVCHVAYPFINNVPLEQIYDAAITGTMNLLNLAANTESVKQFIFCSSFAAIGFADSYPEGTIVNDDSWTPEDAKILDGYMKSKILVEKMMWKFIKSSENKRGMSFTSIAPYMISGPLPWGYRKLVGVMGLIKLYITGGLDVILHYHLNNSDVRDLSKSFVSATNNKEAFNERFLLVEEKEHLMSEIVDILKRDFPAKYSEKVPTAVSPPLTISKITDSSKARRILNFNPIPFEESIKQSIENIIERENL